MIKVPMDRPTLPLTSKRILVVEDNPDMRDVLTQMLQIEGYFVYQAKDGQAALEILQHQRLPELILSDVQMPNLDGFELYQQVRKETRLLTIPFIFMISDPAEITFLIRELGVDDYLVKPINYQELINRVHSRLLRYAEVRIAYLDQTYLDTVNVIANTIEGRDSYTRGHVDRVVDYARRLGTALGWPEEQMRSLEFGARLHDIGKICVPDEILKKPNQLTSEEWVWMKRHTLEGARIVQDIYHLHISIPYILYHHERWDGSGYPHGLIGRDIPIEGRLLAIADVFDALTTDRPYRVKQPIHQVKQYLRDQAGKLFDPDLVPIFLENVDTSGFA